MKKLFLFVFVLSLASLSFAQTITIGTGTSTSSTGAGPLQVPASSQAVPYYSHRVIIYTAAELQTAFGGAYDGNFTRLEWAHPFGNGMITNNTIISIKMKLTSLANLATADSWDNWVSGATEVYNSSTANIDPGETWVGFDITPFAFNTAGGQNLMILVASTQQSATSYGTATSWRYTTATSMVRYFNSATALVTSTSGAMSVSSNRGNLRFTYSTANYATLTAITGNRNGLIGQPVWYKYVVKNTGTDANSYGLSVTGNTWTTGIYDAVDGNVIGTTGSLAPGASFDAFVKVTVPGGATAGQTDPHTFNATGTFTPTAITRTTTAQSTIYVESNLDPASSMAFEWDDPIANGHTESGYIALSGNVHDDGLISYTTQENFTYYGYTIPAGSTIGIGTNGNILFTGTLSPMTYNSPTRSITLYATDLGGSTSRNAAARIFTNYDAANHTTTISWYNWPKYTHNFACTYTMQAVLNHNDNTIVLRYNTIPTGAHNVNTTYISGIPHRTGLINHATTANQAAITILSSTLGSQTEFGNLASGAQFLIHPIYPAPTGYQPANGASSIPLDGSLSWTATGQTTFDVYLGTSNPPPLFASAQVGTTYAPAGLISGTLYYWQIVHHYNGQADYTSSVYSFTTVSSDAPAGPLTGSSANIGSTSVDVGWIDNSTNEDYFKVYVAEGAFAGDFDPTIAVAAAQVASTTIPDIGGAYSQTVSGLTPNTTYAVRVYAVNDNTVMKSGGKGKTGIIRSEWIETEAAVPVYETVIRTGKDGKNVAEFVPSVMKAGKGYWRNLSDDNNGETMGVDELFYSSSFASTNFTTLAATPDAPTLSNPWVTHLYVTVNNNGTTPNSAATQYAIYETTTSQYVQTSGALGAAAAWQTITQWGTKQVTGLSTGTSYTMQVKARNSGSIETGFGATATLATVSPPATLFPISYTGPAVAITDNAPASPAILTINVPSAFVTNYLTVTLSLTHTYVGDLQIRLRAPDLTEVEMFHQHGGTGENMSDLVFDDAAATSITTISTVGPYTGSYRPYASLQTMSGKAALGNWSLVVTDHAGQDVGSVTAFTINFDHFINNQQNANGEGSQEPFAPTFPADPSTGGQPPLVINFPAQNGANTNPGSVTATVYDERPAGVSNTELPPANTINRFWDIQTSTTNFQNAELRLRFTTADLPAGITDPMTATPPLVSAYSSDGGTTWHTWGGVIFDLGGGVYEMVITGLTHFSLWSLGNSGVLPVELSAFSAAASDRAVVLNWRTESETNNDFFRVYRSESSTERGELVGVVDGLGNNQTTHSYRFVDSRVQNGVTYYYRIADVDLNGIEALHPIVVNATPTAGANGIVPTEYVLEQNMPNPFNPTTEIRYSVKEAGLVTLKVFDISGREVATLVNGNHPANNYRVSFDATKLSAGVYFYQIRVNDFYAVRKMVVAK